MLLSRGGENALLGEPELREFLTELTAPWKGKKRILILPPDFTRFPSGAGRITTLLWELLGERIKAVLPALGTHFPMTAEEKRRMFPGLPDRLMVDHDWQNDLVELGRIEADYLRRISGGRMAEDWPVQVNRLLVEQEWDLILSIGQIVPHEVVGMSNYTKNVLIGAGGREAIHKSHYLGALCGMENVMGRSDSPVRQLLDEGARRFCSRLPLLYIHTVVSADREGVPRIRGIFAGDDDACYRDAARLSRRVNLHLLDRAPAKVVVSLDPEEYRSTWLGNKSIYRTRMALADGGELIILAPGLRCFGENPFMDGLIRRYGYRGTEKTLRAVRENRDLREGLSVAAHLIHGSSEGRFAITYCPGALSRREIEGVGFGYGDLAAYSRLYNPAALQEGWNRGADGEEFFYVSQPALGLWAEKSRFGAEP